VIVNAVAVLGAGIVGAFIAWMGFNASVAQARASSKQQARDTLDQRLRLTIAEFVGSIVRRQDSILGTSVRTPEHSDLMRRAELMRSEALIFLDPKNTRHEDLIELLHELLMWEWDPQEAREYRNKVVEAVRVALSD
jgi:hypothetical protein